MLQLIRYFCLLEFQSDLLSGVRRNALRGPDVLIRLEFHLRLPKLPRRDPPLEQNIKFIVGPTFVCN